MAIPTINTSATDIELTSLRESLIAQKLAPLARLLPDEREVTFDVILRRVPVTFGGYMYYVSVKLTTERGEFLSAATAHYLTRALNAVRESLRRTLSRGESVNYQKTFVPHESRGTVSMT
jgi:ribosome-associated translation inhibitor RaiA